MDFIIDKPWGMHVLMGAVASTLWIIVWTTMWLRGGFDEVAGKGVPVLLIGFVPCIPFGAIVLAAATIFGLVVAAMWMSNVMFGWFDYQLSAIKQVFAKDSGTEEQGEGEVPSKKPRKKKRKKSP
jgi:hypothetical protein